eukprot:COSAG02_NODE_1506_length_12232_cov_420.616088_9_plen_188_part_00
MQCIGLYSGATQRAVHFFLSQAHCALHSFWDDVWNPTCNIHDQTKDTCVDMGIGQEGKVSPTLTQLTKDYQANMKALREATLKAGKFAWQVGSKFTLCSWPCVVDGCCGMSQSRRCLYQRLPAVRCCGRVAPRIPSVALAWGPLSRKVPAVPPRCVRYVLPIVHPRSVQWDMECQANRTHVLLICYR